MKKKKEKEKEKEKKKKKNLMMKKGIVSNVRKHVDLPSMGSAPAARHKDISRVRAPSSWPYEMIRRKEQQRIILIH